MKIMYSVIIALFAFNFANARVWKWINPFPQGNNLWNVKFVNTNTGFAVGLHIATKFLKR
jgi:hypothetical protein